MSIIQTGKEHLKDLYTNQPETIKSGIEWYHKEGRFFDKNLKLLNQGCALFYDFNSHSFEYLHGGTTSFSSTKRNWVKDHQIHKINGFVRCLFPRDEGKQESVKAYLYHQFIGDQFARTYIAGSCRPLALNLTGILEDLNL